MSDERIPIDQLLDLVEGTLPEDEAARLEAALDEADRRELAVQAAVRTVLGQLPGPELSDDERQRLRAAVRAELRVEEARPAPSESRQERRSWLARVIPSAAAAATVVAVIAVAINLVGDTDSGQEASMAETVPVAAEQAAAVTAAPATTAAAAPAMAAEAPEDTADPAAMVEETAAERAVEADMDAALADEAAAEADEAAPMMEEAMAEAPAAEMEADVEAEVEADEAAEEAARAVAAASEAASLGPGYVAFEVATDRPEEARAMLEMVEELVAYSEMAPVPVAEIADRAGEEDLVCWQGAADLAGAGGVILWMAPGLVDGVAGEAYLIVPGPEDRPGAGVLALFVYPDCRAVALRAVTGE